MTKVMSQDEMDALVSEHVETVEYIDKFGKPYEPDLVAPPVIPDDDDQDE